MKKIASLLLLVALATTVSAQINLQNSLLAHLPLNGNGTDVSVNGNNATPSATGVYGSQDMLNKPNAAMFFNGAIEQGALDFGTPLLNNRTDFSMSFWFNPASLTSGMSLVGQDNILETSFNTVATRITVYHPTGGNVNINLSQGAGVWQHLAVTCSPTQMQIFLNGILTKTLSGNYSLGNNTTNTKIGGNVINQSNNSWFRGNIDEVFFYTRVLTQDEISFLSGSMSLTYALGTPSSTDLCAGGSLTLPFTVIGTNIDTLNIFTAQLSDESGNFTNPYSIGSVQTYSSSAINAVIPSNIPYGTGYKVRIVSSLPQSIGTTSSFSLIINNPSESFSTLKRGRLVWYKFDTNAADSSGSGLNGTLNGGTSYVTDRFGNATGALQLNGSSGYVAAPTGVWFNGPYSISCWVKPAAFNNWSRIYDFANGSANDNVLTVISQGTTGNIQAEHYVATSSGGNVNNVPGMKLNQWNHVVTTYDGTTVKIYVNGVFGGSAAISAPRYITRNNCYIGRSNWSGDAYANAAFDDFMIYNRVLSGDEIKTLLNDGIVYSNYAPCNGNYLQLNAPELTGASYQWSGPNSFSSTQRQNIITNVSSSNSGNYSLAITQGSCTAFVQQKNITVNTASGQVVPTFSILPYSTDVQASKINLTGSPAGGYYSGTGIVGTQFDPLVAGVGTHIIVYNVPHASGCLMTKADTIIVNTSYGISTSTTTACSGGFYDSGGSGVGYLVNEDFTQTFYTGSANRYRFTFSSFNFGTGDTLFVYDGQSTSDYLIAYYLQGSGADVLWSSGSYLTFRFKSDGSSQSNGWASSFQCMANPALSNEVTTMTAGMNSVCALTLYDPSGTSNYGQGFWRQAFRAGQGQRLRFKYSTFAINGNNGGHWLRIYDGPNSSYPLIGAYNNFNWLPPNIESTGEYMTFEFDGTNTGAGYGGNSGFTGTLTCTGSVYPVFQMKDTTINTCSGVFSDPGGLNANYGNGQLFTETFCSGNAQKMRITFNPNEVGFAAGDTLWVFDGNSVSAPPLATFISSSKMEPMKSSGTCLTFKFKSDASSVSQGWQGYINCVTTQSAQDTISMSSGTRNICDAIVKDPAGDNTYGQGFWRQTYRSYNGNRLKFDYTTFAINGNNGGHWLRIYDGPDATYPLIGAYNNFNWIPASIESSGEYLTFEFDANNTGAGYGGNSGVEGHLYCTTPVLPVYNMSNGTVNTCDAVFYDNGGPNANYTNTFTATQTFCSLNGEQLQISFNKNETGFGTGDTLWAFDGSDTTASPLAMYIAGSKMETLNSSGTCITFYFTSNSSSTSAGWQGFVKCLTSAPAVVSYIMSSGIRNVCSGNLLDPGGTGDYPVGAGNTFIQTYISYSGEKLRITMNSFNVNGNNGGHWLRVYDGPATTYSLIGSYNNFNWPPSVIQSSGSSLTFRFEGTNTSAGADPGFDWSISCFSGNPIDAGWLSSPACVGSSVKISYVANNTVTAGNVFTAQISDANGSFASAVAIGSFTSTATTGTITCTIPLSLPAGNGYRVRIISSLPAQIGNQSPNPLTVMPLPTQPVVTAAGGTSICAGTSLLLSVASQPNVTYQWKMGTSSVGISINTFTVTQAGNYYIQLSNNCGTVNSNTVSVIVIPLVTPSVSVAASPGNSVCAGITVSLTATPVNGGGGPVYQWYLNGNPAGTNSPVFNSGSFANTDRVNVVLISNATCQSSSTATSNTITMAVTPVVVPSVSISSSASAICSGQMVSYTATPVNGGSTPVYQWYRNGNATGTNSAVYSSTGLNNNDVISVALSSNAVCATPATVMSNTLSLTVNALPTVNALASATIICSGQPVTLSGSGADVYSWTAGVNNAQAFNPASSGSYTVTGTDNTTGCSNRNSVSITVNPVVTASVNINIGSAGAICAGNTATITATIINGGSSPSYQWYLNGNPAGTNSAVFTSSTLNNNDKLTAALTSNAVCLSSSVVYSNTITVVVTATVAPSVSITSSANTICETDTVIFSAAAINGGANPFYQWYVNGSAVGTNTVNYVSSSLNDKDVISVMLSSGAACAIPQNVMSNTLAVTVHALPQPTVIKNGANLNTQTFVSYQWMLGGIDITGATSYTYTATQTGWYSVRVSDTNGCINESAGSFVSTTGTENFNGLYFNVSVYPNPANDHITISVDDIDSGQPLFFSIVDLIGKEVFSGKITVQGHKAVQEINVEQLPAGIYKLSIREGENTVMRKIAVE